MFRIIKQLFCKHEPSAFRALNSDWNDRSVMCKKCYKMYITKPNGE